MVMDEVCSELRTRWVFETPSPQNRRRLRTGYLITSRPACGIGMSEENAHGLSRWSAIREPSRTLPGAPKGLMIRLSAITPSRVSNAKQAVQITRRFPRRLCL